MEDGVEDIQNIVLENRSPGEAEKEVGKQTEERDEAKASGGGIINNLIANLVSKGDEEEVPEGKEEEKEGGGLINNLISNLVSPRAKEGEEKKGNELKVTNGDGAFKSNDELGVGSCDGGGGGGGGIINNLIANIFHQDQGGGDEKDKDVEGNGKQVKPGGGRGGLMDNLVSNLQTSLTQDAAPATDEASILIHSIVHD